MKVFITSQRYQVNLKNCFLQALSSAKTNAAPVKYLAQDEDNGDTGDPNTHTLFIPLKG